jgi:hypothetical protein
VCRTAFACRGTSSSGDLGRLDRTQMRNSRQAKNLVSAAEWHLDHVHDEQLAEPLRQWLTVKPRLVQVRTRI